MRAVSLFSGVGGLDYGLSLAGIDTVLQVEIDPWCQAVLERHFPGVERVSDVRDVGCELLRDAGGTKWAGGTGPDRARTKGGGGPDGEGGRGPNGIDLVHGGFPCQDVSVAGNRAGFRGSRSSLWFEFHRILSLLRPRWTLIENVPGLLSSNSGRDFGAILGGLVDLGYGVSWRVLDAQFAGVPQRRRRVFIVGCLGDAARAGAVLAVCEGCGGDPAAGGEAGQEPAGSLAAGAHPSGFNGQDAYNGHLVVGPELSPAVEAHGAKHGNAEGGHSPLLVASAVRASDGHHGHSSPRGDGADNPIPVVADPISANEGKTYTHEGKNNFRLHNVIAFDWQASDGGADESFQGKSRTYIVRAGDYAGVSATRHDAISGAQGVRRLTPLECERLQGFPDDWLDIEPPLADSHKYRMLGNAVCVPVATWLGWRLRHVDADR